MTYLAFKRELHNFELFSIRDIIKLFPEFDSRRLVEWQNKGYIQKLINKWYLFSDIPMKDNLRYRISNCLYRPSYISMESALSHYNLIPETVYTVQNISTRKTISYDTPIGSFHYRNIRPNLFFGYRADRRDGVPILMAEPEKTILDYLYFNANINTVEAIDGLRLNMAELNSIIDWTRLERYAACFESAVLNKRIRLLQKSMSHANFI